MRLSLGLDAHLVLTFHYLHRIVLDTGPREARSTINEPPVGLENSELRHYLKGRVKHLAVLQEYS